MSSSTKTLLIEAVATSIDIPASAYEKAEARYKDVGDWFGRAEARCHLYAPHIHAQGSFRLGTVTRPVHDDGEYDLDMGCRLRVGVAKGTHTQADLKELVGADLEDYRVARAIKAPREEKHRCWRLKYADALHFHLDAVPSIPENRDRRQLIERAIVERGAPGDLARNVASFTGAITDDRMWNYRIIDDEWLVSNPEGLARWFESRMKLSTRLMESVAREAKAAKIDDLPAHLWKSPLQRCVQLLKRHRDIIFGDDPDGMPASVILTTLAAEAYRGESDLAEALETILFGMAKLVNPTSPRVPNPVNPAEDFADRWREPGSQREAIFWRWLEQAQDDFEEICTGQKPERIVEAAKRTLGALLNTQDLSDKLGLRPTGFLLKPAAVPAALSFPNKPLIPPKPPAGFA